MSCKIRNMVKKMIKTNLKLECLLTNTVSKSIVGKMKEILFIYIE